MCLLRCGDVKKGLLIALVILVVLTGIPVVIAMPGMACQDCGSAALMGGSGCALIVLAFRLFLVFGSQFLRARREQGLRLVPSFAFERPPRLA
jgi:heme/copper-type cytochrome/quinol oxidase subunit 4